MLSMVATNINETSEFLKLLPNSFFIVVVSVVLLVFFLFFIQQPRNRLQKKHAGIFVILVIILLAPKFYKSTKDGLDVIRMSYPARNLTYIYGATELYKSYQDDMEAMKSSDYNATTSPENLKSLHILVIGESARRKNFSLYGYKRDTNAYLNQIKDELTIFDNVYSASNSTVMSLRWSLSKKVDSQIITVPNLFKKAGFESIWLSNQGQFGENLNATSALALTSEKAIFVNNSDFGARSYDEKLVPILQEQITNDKGQFIILHLLGSHFHYKRRYPESFDKFSNQKPPRTDNLDKDQEQIINEYDNSILYTDYILAKIVNFLKTLNRPTTITYLSDHGEILYDGEALSYGHGGGKEPTTDELKIPFIFWANDKYFNLFESKKAFLNSVKSTRFSTVDFINFYTSLLDIELKDMQLPKLESQNIYYYNAHGIKTLFKED